MAKREEISTVIRNEISGLLVAEGVLALIQLNVIYLVKIILETCLITVLFTMATYILWVVAQIIRVALQAEM